MEIASDEKVIVGNPAYLAELAKILRDTEPSVVNDYLVWRSVQSVMSSATDAARAAKQRFNAVISVSVDNCTTNLRIGQ